MKYILPLKITKTYDFRLLVISEYFFTLDTPMKCTVSSDTELMNDLSAVITGNWLGL